MDVSHSWGLKIWSLKFLKLTKMCILYLDWLSKYLYSQLRGENQNRIQNQNQIAHTKTGLPRSMLLSQTSSLSFTATHFQRKIKWTPYHLDLPMEAPMNWTWRMALNLQVCVRSPISRSSVWSQFIDGMVSRAFCGAQPSWQAPLPTYSLVNDTGRYHWRIRSYCQGEARHLKVPRRLSP